MLNRRRRTIKKVVADNGVWFEHTRTPKIIVIIVRYGWRYLGQLAFRHKCDERQCKQADRKFPAKTKYRDIASSVHLCKWQLPTKDITCPAVIEISESPHWPEVLVALWLGVETLTVYCRWLCQRITTRDSQTTLVLEAWSSSRWIYNDEESGLQEACCYLTYHQKFSLEHESDLFAFEMALLLTRVPPSPLACNLNRLDDQHSRFSLLTAWCR